MELDQLVIWLIIGALAGSLAGWLVRGDRRGFGALGNIVIGLIGAVIGGFVFDALDINLGLGEIRITAEDLVAAFVGSLILLQVLAFLRKR
ncbi:MAG: GlsB/YeaQ/YmgE family stress response membrane protein [Anaerolineae bacterium]|nr:GlsB/YeaQ/YmgE family stress response membrane protein [Anaerolineae bacterium]